MAQQVVNNIGQGALTPPSVAQRYLGNALLTGIVVFLGVAFVSLTLLWRALPALPVLPTSLKDLAVGMMGYGLHGLLPFLYPETAHEMRRYLTNLSGQGLAHLLYVRLVVAGGLGLAAGIWMAILAATPRDGLMHTRGRRLLRGKEAIQAAQRIMRAQIKKLGRDFLIHPLIGWTYEQWTKGVIIFGAIGGGKTTVILGILEQIFAANDRAIIFDVKGDFTAKFENATLIAPWHRDGKVWAIAQDCTTKQRAVAFADGAIEDSKDPMWGKAARQVFVGLIVDLQNRKPGCWGFKDLYDQFSRTDEDELIMLMETCNPLALHAVKSANQTTSGILINMVAGLEWISSLADAWGNPKPGEGVSFEAWLTDEKYKDRQILLQGNAEFETMTKGYVTAIVSILSARIAGAKLRDSRTRKLWFIFDEFPQMGKVPYMRLAALSRSKGGRLVIGLQDINQIITIYSEQEANALFSLIGTKIVAQVAPGETAKKVSDLLGEREVERLNLSISGSGSGKSTTSMMNRESIKVMYDSELSYELGNRPALGGVLALLINNDWPFALELLWPHKNIPDVRDPYVEAEWVGGNKKIGDGYLASQEQISGAEHVMDPGSGRAGKERELLALEQEEFYKARDRAAKQRLEALLGPAPAKTEGHTSSKSGSTNASDRIWLATTAVSGAIVGGHAESQRRHNAERDRAASELGAQLPPEHGSENFAIDAADAHHLGEGASKLFGLETEGQHVAGLVAMAPVLADALRSSAPPTDPVEIRRRQQSVARQRIAEPTMDSRRPE
jgi:hypothetical protein